MPLGMEAGLSPGHIVLAGNPAPLPKKGTEPPIFGPCLLWPNGCMDQDATWYGGKPRPRPHCARWGPMQLPSPKRGHSPHLHPQFSVHVYCAQTAEWIKTSLGMKVDLDPRDTVLNGTQFPSPKRGQTPIFWPMSIVPKPLDGPRCHLVWKYRPQPKRHCVR